MSTQDDQQQHHHEAHPSRLAFANEVADIVEQRIWAKTAKWILLNIGGLIGAISVGIGAYYSLESRINHASSIDSLTVRQIDAMTLEHGAIKSSLAVELREIKSEVSEINRYLRDHPLPAKGTTGDRR